MAIGSVMGQKIDGFTKSETLTSATSSKYGLPVGTVPDDVFEKIKSLIDSNVQLANSKAKVFYSTYTGTDSDKSSKDASKTFNAPFEPKVFMVQNSDPWLVENPVSSFFAVKPNSSTPNPTSVYALDGSTGDQSLDIKWSGNSVTLHCTRDFAPAYVFNYSKNIYSFVCIG